MSKPGASPRCPTSYDTNDRNEVKEEELSQDERAALEATVWKKFDIWVLPLCTNFFLLATLVCSRIQFHAQFS